MTDDLELRSDPQPGQTSWNFPDTVESVVPSRTNGPLIAAAAVLWIKPEDDVLDMTYGRGKFWTHYRPEKLTTNDLDPDSEATFHHDFRRLPWSDGTFDVAVFDPPYISPGGRDTSTVEDFNDRYGLTEAPQTTDQLKGMIESGISEGARVLRPKGRLFVKCMDYQEGSTFHTMRQFVCLAAGNVGHLVQVDEFVHYSGTGPQPSGRRQHVSRRAHSFLCIFRKPVNPLRP